MFCCSSFDTVMINNINWAMLGLNSIVIICNHSKADKRESYDNNNNKFLILNPGEICPKAHITHTDMQHQPVVRQMFSINIFVCKVI